MHRLLAQQLAQATDAQGSVDVAALLATVDAAYAEADRSLQRTNRVALLLSEEMEHLNGELTRLAQHDALTNLPNRTLFVDRLNQALTIARRDASRVGVLYLDLDHFKSLNETLGHAAGDALLCAVAERLRSCLRGNHTAARLGGDEFAIIASRIHHPRDVEALARRLIQALRPAIDLGGEMTRVGATIGIALSDPAQDDTAERMMKAAGTALYQAKDNGRGGFSFFVPEMNVRLLERRAIEQDMRAALATDSMFLHYQPQVELASRAIVGAEALIRWNRRGRGLVGPDHFIPIAEDAGLIEPIGTFVLMEACRQAAHWPNQVSVAVNVSPVQFSRPQFVNTVRSALKQAGLPPARLELEITEGVLLRDTADVAGILSRLRSLGVRLALDDFGTGYSSLGYLRKFRFDKIKIDRSFICELGDDSNAMAIVRAVVGLSETLHICPNAEGVETPAQAALLLRHGCKEAQGYLYGRPMPAGDFAEMIGTACCFAGGGFSPGSMPTGSLCTGG